MKSIILPAIMIIAFCAGSNAMGMRFDNSGAVYFNRTPVKEIESTAPGDSLFTLDQLKTNLALTQQQIPVVDSILTAASNKLNSVTDPGMTGQQNKQKIINNAYMSIENILTAEQRTKFENMKTKSTSTGY